MYIPYNPCDNCKEKYKRCTQCQMTIMEINYHDALNKIRELSAELGKKITILV